MHDESITHEDRVSEKYKLERVLELLPPEAEYIVRELRLLAEQRVSAYLASPRWSRAANRQER
jgi:hypothetical protein